MPASIDLYILPLARQNGQDQPSLPGLYAALPPRRAARGREADRLLFYLTLVGSMPMPADQTLVLLESLAESYFKASGTATAAMRSAAEALNQFLLERNLRNSNTGRQSIGWLTQAVLRSDMLYIAHCGPVHAYLLAGAEPRHLYDPASSGRGLGVSRQVSLRYFHVTLQPGQFALLAHQPCAAWEGEALHVSPNQGMETLRRRLVSHPDLDLSALLIQAQNGTGKLNLLRLRTPAADMAQPAASAPPQPGPAITMPVIESLVSPAQPSAQQALETGAPLFTEPAFTPPAGSGQAALAGAAAAQPAVRPAQAEPGAQPAPQPAVRPVAPARPPQASQPAPKAAGAVPERRTTPRPAGTNAAFVRVAARLKKAAATIFLALRVVWRAIKNSLRQMGQALLTLLRRLLPDETMLDISPSTLMFLTIAIPLLIGVVGAVVYIERGQEAQYQVYYEQAYNQAAQAQAQTDPGEQRKAWNAVLDALDQAESYRLTGQSQQLRLQARGVLDALDGVQRLDFQPAIIGGLDDQARITRLAATSSLGTSGELYMLDGSEGRVLRALSTGGGYQLDPTFACGPIPGPVYVGPLVDMMLLPRPTEQGATLLAMDANRVLLFCIPGGQALIQQIAPPTTNFGSPTAFDLNEGDLYILDPTGNAVWIYRGMDFSQPPHLFFGDQIPFMADVIDLAVNKDDLYLLHTDGHFTRCTYSLVAGSPTRCDDPLPYTDRRPGRQGGPVIPDSLFSQVFYAPPPDPSLYLLDPANQAVFHMGLQLSFQTQYRANQALPQGKASAFAVSPNRLMFLAVGNQVYYAAMP